MTQRWLALLPLLALAGCGGGQSSPAKSVSGAVIEIPEPSDQQASAAAEETPAPAARRTQGPSTVSGAEDEPAASDTPWAQPSPWGSTGGGGPDCDRAADCCLKVVQRNGPDPSLLSMCDSVRQAPHSSCTHLLASFRSVAPQIGIQCN